MKYLFLLLCIPAIAFSWETKDLNGKIHLLDSRYNVDEIIIASKSENKNELSVKEINQDLTLITYFVNFGGTKDASLTFNCSLFSSKLKKFIFKDNLCKTITKKNKLAKTDEVVEANISILPKEIIYQYEELVEKYNR